jgi:hypothetical protein
MLLDYEHATELAAFEVPYVMNEESNMFELALYEPGLDLGPNWLRVEGLSCGLAIFIQSRFQLSNQATGGLWKSIAMTKSSRSLRALIAHYWGGKLSEQVEKARATILPQHDPRKEPSCDNPASLPG